MDADDIHFIHSPPIRGGVLFTSEFTNGCNGDGSCCDRPAGGAFRGDRLLKAVSFLSGTLAEVKYELWHTKGPLYGGTNNIGENPNKKGGAWFIGDLVN